MFKEQTRIRVFKEAGVDVKVKEYLKEPLTKPELKSLFKKLQMSPDQVVRKKESLYKELGLDKESLSASQWIDMIVENPKLLERPILVAGDKAAIGRPTENFNDLI